MKQLAIVTAAGMVLAACSSSEPPRAQETGTESVPATESLTEREAVQLALETDRSIYYDDRMGMLEDDQPIAWREPNLEQRYTAINFNSVVVTDSAKDLAGNWQSVSHQSSASFSLLHIASGGLDQYAVFGLARDRDLIVEIWKLVPATGTVVVQGVGGGVAVPGLVPKQFQKTRIFKGAANHKPVAIEYDPSDRFVVCAIRTPADVVSLNQLDLTNPSAPPTRIVDSNTIPELAAVQYAQKFDHALLGRVYVFGTSFEDRHRIVLVDADDNGVFDGAPIVGDDAWFEAQGLAHYEDWVGLNY